MKDLRFAITTDAHNFIINELRVHGEKSNNEGETYYKPIGYYTTLEQALTGLVRKGLLLDVGENPIEILKAITAQQEEIKLVVKEFGAYRKEQVRLEIEAYEARKAKAESVN
jgi:hypothetical protein